MSCNSCGQNTNKTPVYKHPVSCDKPVHNVIPKLVNPCDPVQPYIPCPPRPCPKDCADVCGKVPCVPKCRKSVKDACRVKPCPPCVPCDCHKNKKCIRKTKCKFASVKDKCRNQKPCCPEKPKCCPKKNCDSYELDAPSGDNYDWDDNIDIYDSDQL
jgi:hypothetical protein